MLCATYSFSGLVRFEIEANTPWSCDLASLGVDIWRYKAVELYFFSARQLSCMAITCQLVFQYAPSCLGIAVILLWQDVMNFKNTQIDLSSLMCYSRRNTNWISRGIIFMVSLLSLPKQTRNVSSFFWVPRQQYLTQRLAWFANISIIFGFILPHLLAIVALHLHENLIVQNAKRLLVIKDPLMDVNNVRGQFSL